MITLKVLALSAALLASEEFELPTIESESVVPVTKALVATMNEMSIRDASHLSAAQNSLSDMARSVATEVDSEWPGVRMSAMRVERTASGKGWDIRMLAETMFPDIRSNTQAKCIALLGEAKSKLGYQMNGQPNGTMLDIDDIPGGAIAVAHKNALDQSQSDAVLDRSETNAEFIRRQSWLYLTIPYIDSGVSKQLQCKNKIRNSSVQVSG